MKYRAQRYPTRFPVTITKGAVGMKSLVSSISATGACVQVDAPMAVGDKVVLQYLNQRQTGKISWSSTDRAGLVFDRPLGKVELDRIRFGLRSAMAPQSHRRQFSEMR